MKLIFTFIILFIAFSVSAQDYNQLLLRKNGIAIKRFTEGSVIHLKSKLGLNYKGTIYLIQNDSIYFSDNGISINDIAAVYKKTSGRSPVIPVSKELFLYSNLGIPLFAAGLTISGEPFIKALLFGIGIVYAPIIIYNMKRVIGDHNRKYVIGKKFDLKVLDLHPAEIVPQKRQ